MFTMVFDEEMKARGFKRKGRCYSKLVGEMLHGITMKPTNPFEICYNVVPYWTMEILNEYRPPLYNKGYWIEDGGSFDGCYYKEENEEKNLLFFTLCLDIVKQSVIPVMETITNEMGYVKWPAGIFEMFPSQFGEKYKPFDEKMSCIRYYYVNKFLLDYCLVNLANQMGKTDITDEIANYWMIKFNEKNLSRMCEKYAESKEKNDFSWIEDFKNEQKKLVLPKLRDNLGLDTFAL